MALPEEVVNSFPEEIRSDPSWEKFDDIGAVAKSYVEVQKMNGNAIRIPDEKAAPEDAQKWWGETQAKLAARGFVDLAPQTPDKYEFVFEGVDPETVKNDPVLNQFRGIAHKHGIGNKLANELVKEFASSILPGFMPQEVSEEDAVKSLQETLGPKFAEEVTRAKAAVKRVSASIPELTDALIDAKVMVDGKAIAFGNFAPFVKLFSLVDRLTSQDSSGHIGKGSGVDMSLGAIDAQIAELRANTALPSEEIGKRLVALYKQKDALTGGKSTTEG